MTSGKRNILFAVFVFILSAQVTGSSYAGGKATGREVVALVNGEKIYRSDYGKWLLDNTNSNMLVENYVSTILFRKEAEQFGIAVSGEDIEKALTERVAKEVSLLKRDEQLYAGMLKTRGLSEQQLVDKLKNQYRREVISDLYASRIIFKEKGISEHDIKNSFNERFGKDGRKYSLEHIFKSITPVYLTRADRGYESSLKAEEESARHKLEYALKMLDEAGGTDYFGMIAEKVSEDVFTKDYQGYIGKFVSGMYGGEFDTVVPGLRKGEVSGILKSNRGFHIVKINDREENETDISHILKKVDYDYVKDIEQWKERLKDKESVLDRIKRLVVSGKDFKELSQKESDDYSSRYGSDISGRWELVFGTEFEAELEKHKKGDMFIAESEAGLHLFLLEDIFVTEYSVDTRERIKEELLSGTAKTQQLIDLSIRLMRKYNVYYKL